MKNYFLILIFLVSLLPACKDESIKTVYPKLEVKRLKEFCFIKNFYTNDKNYAVVDFIDYLKKNELEPKAGSFKIIELPDDYCYLNKEEKLENYEISDSVKIVMQKFSFDAEGNFNFGQSIKLTDLIAEAEKSKLARFLSSPYEIEILNNKIISIREIYIP